jgi:hypothetical protein
MNAFPKLAAAGLFALSLGAGAVLASGPARAESWTDCSGGVCTRTTCDDAGYCSKAYYDSDRRPERWACDAAGYDCHWTRSYYLDEYSNPVYDPYM